MSNNAKVFPKPKFSKLTDGMGYECQGSCSCNFIKDRTRFDNDQKSLYSFQNTAIPYEALNQYYGGIKPFLNKEGKLLSKYIGI